MSRLETATSAKCDDPALRLQIVMRDRTQKDWSSKHQSFYLLPKRAKRASPSTTSTKRQYMPKFDQDDTFLARWLSGELTEEERTAFEQRPEYQDFKRIAEQSKTLRPPAYQREAAWKQLQGKTTGAVAPTAAKVRRLRPWRAIAAAIVLLLLAGGGWIWTGSTTITTLAEEKREVTLPDGSTVQMNSQSTLAYNKNLWRWSRQLELRGEAFFAVEKGERFTVKTDNGAVQVLGTSFNVYTRRAVLEVHCFTGRVAVRPLSGQSATTLNPSEAVKLNVGEGAKTSFAASDAPKWRSGQTDYQAAPLSRVLDDLEAQFGIQFDRKAINERTPFTGVFLHENVDVALGMVLDPMKIRYERNGRYVTLGGD